MFARNGKIGTNMQGKTHLICGLASGLAVVLYTSPSPAIAGAAITAAGYAALLPDIDHRNSTISHKIRPARLFFRWFGHRGFTHSLAALALLAGVCFYFLPPTLSLAILAGYSSHILADVLTTEGVGLFWPNGGRVTLLPIRTGGLIEYLFRVGMISVTLFLAYETVLFYK